MFVPQDRSEARFEGNSFYFNQPPGRLGYGRFMQADPIGYEAGMNLYGYVGGDPVNRTDPSGLCTPDPDASATVCGRRIDGPGGVVGGTFGMGFGNPATGGRVGNTAQERTPPPPPPICRAVARDGDSVTIAGQIEFLPGNWSPTAPGSTISLPGEVPERMQTAYVGMINQVWSRQIGRYSVSTRMSIGPGMITAYIGNPGAGGAAELGGSRMWLWPLPNPMDTPTAANYRINVGHEFGHLLGVSHPAPGVDSGIMNPGAGGPPLESHVEETLQRCDLEE